jgi:hypothetical protein
MLFNEKNSLIYFDGTREKHSYVEYIKKCGEKLYAITPITENYLLLIPSSSVIFYQKWLLKNA